MISESFSEAERGSDVLYLLHGKYTGGVSIELMEAFIKRRDLIKVFADHKKLI